MKKLHCLEDIHCTTNIIKKHPSIYKILNTNRAAKRTEQNRGKTGHKHVVESDLICPRTSSNGKNGFCFLGGGGASSFPKRA